MWVFRQQELQVPVNLLVRFPLILPVVLRQFCKLNKQLLEPVQDQQKVRLVVSVDCLAEEIREVEECFEG